MKLFKTLRFAKQPEVRASAESALVNATRLPNSGIAFVDNSQGSSAAIAELSTMLNIALEQFDYEAEPSDQLQLQLQRLYKQGTKYANSNLDDSVQAQQWDCSPAEAEVIAIAFACAAAVYDTETSPSLQGFTFDQKDYIFPSFGGTAKATSFTLVSRSPSYPSHAADSLLPILVVAVRGTAGHADYMINLNDRSTNIESLLAVEDLCGNAKNKEPVFAHGGLLHSAETLVPPVSKRIDALIEKHKINHVLFTGHSAGGAVSSLLFAKHLSRAPTDYPSLKFSSISFGAPPVTRPNLTPYILGNSLRTDNRGIVLSIVNEYDLVSRADGAYALSLIDLYRSIYKLPPIQDDDSRHRLKLPTPQLPRFSFDARTGEQEGDRLPVWPLPQPEYWQLGQIVVFKVKLAEGTMGTGSGFARDELILRAVTISPEEFVKLLFCDVSSHRRVSYQERIDLLLKGRFNGKRVWD